MPFLEAYADFLNDERYSHESFLVKTHLIIQFSQWLRRENVAVPDLTLQHAEVFWRERRGRPGCRGGEPTTLRAFMRWLHSNGIVSSQAVQTGRRSRVDALVDEYTAYLTQERGLAATSIEQYAALVRRFLNRSYSDGNVRLRSLNAREITAFVLQEVKRYRTSKPAALLTVAVRSFLRFAQYRGYIKKNLITAVPAVAGWSMASIPRALPVKSVRRVLEQSREDRTPCRLRDRAILLLLARLGLRAREVMLLEIDDINWSTAALHVHGKGRQERPMPLPHDVGEAIAVYLRDGRPASSCRQVFLRARAPWRGFRRSASIGQIVKRALARSRVQSATKGAHQFRHSLATNMLRQGLSLTEIGQLLRHRSPDTTRLYAKVDLKALREVAVPWPGRPL